MMLQLVKKKPGPMLDGGFAEFHMDHRNLCPS
jgi:hypothetical protein